MQKTVSWILSLAITIIVMGYGICLLERGAHRLLAHPTPSVVQGNIMQHGAPGPGMMDSTGHSGMMHKMGACPDSSMSCGNSGSCDMHGGAMRGGMGSCDMRHDGMCCDDGMRCGPFMRRPFGPPPMLGFAFTAGLGAIVLLIGAVFGMVTLRPKGEKSA